MQFGELKQGDWFDVVGPTHARYIKTDRAIGKQMVINSVCLSDGSYRGFEGYDEVILITSPFIVSKPCSIHSFDFGEENVL